MKNKFLKLLVCLAMAAALLPAAAFAANTEITSVAITVTEPELGATPNKNVTAASVPTDALGYVMDTASWFKCAEDEYFGSMKDFTNMEDGEKFGTGYYYMVYAHVYYDGNSYTPSKGITGTVNGMPLAEMEGASMVDQGPDIPWVVYLWKVYEPLSEQEDEVITNIAVTVTAPKIGETPDFTPTVTTVAEGGATLDEATWFKLAKDQYTGEIADDWETMGEDETFTTGYYYALHTSSIVNDGYQLSKEVTGTVNGKSEDVTEVGTSWGLFVDLHTEFEPLTEEAAAPVIIAGDGTTVTQSEKKDLEFASNAEFTDFIRVELNGKTLDEENYSVRAGSTIVTLKADYAATLPVGEHTLSIVSKTGTATAKFTVNKKTDPASPQTGDNSNVSLWLALLFVSGGAAATTLVGRKQRRAK